MSDEKKVNPVIDDENEKLLFVVQPKNVYFYSPFESLIISRDEFQEVHII